MYLLQANTNSFWESMLAALEQWDAAAFLKINNEWTNSFFDNIFPWWRDSNTWLPLYFFLLLFALFNFGWRVWPWVLFFILTATLTDQVSSSLVKPWINRPRPCSDDVLMYHVRLLLRYCPGNGSFTSSHATNHFGAACYIFFTLKQYFKQWSYLFIFWAVSICYAQVYVGVHYPLDVAGGAVLGNFIGMSSAGFFNRRIGLPPLLTMQKTA